MSNIKVGFSRLDITPPLGIAVSGYYEKRYAKKILDPLEVHAIAFENEGKRAVIINYDLIDMENEISSRIRNTISGFCNVEFDAVFITNTHTHTGPKLAFGMHDQEPEDVINITNDYVTELVYKSRDCVKFAFDDLKESEFFVAEGEAKGISFVRRYRMKDGSVQTNPGVGNPNIDHVLDNASEVLKLVEIKRCGADDIYIANFGVHADVIGGEVISADFPRFVRESVEGALPGVKCVFLNAAEGDVNHINPFPTHNDRVGLCYDSFDSVPRGYEHAKHMGRVIAGSVLSICTKALPIDANKIGFGTKEVEIPSNQENDKLDYAKHILDMVADGRQHELPYKEMELTTAKAEAVRIMNLKDGPESFNIKLTCLRFGDLAFVGLPGEPFTGLGRQIISASPFDTTVVCCLTNGDGYYYPTTAAYDEGGYEVKSAPIKKGVAEIITDAIVDILKEIK